MAFQKGQSGNPAGKPKGVEAKTTKEAKEIFNSIMQGEIDYIQDALKQVRKRDPAKYLDLLSKLLPYFLPKQLDITTNESVKQVFMINGTTIEL